MPRNAGKLQESDFNRSIGEWRGHWIVITLEFDELDVDDEAQAIFCHGNKQINEDASKGSYSLYFRPKKSIRQQLFELSEKSDKNREDLDNILSEVTLDDYEAIYQCRGDADFSDDVIYREFVGDFENLSFSDPAFECIDKLGCHPPSCLSLPNEVACTFVKALRDVVSDLRRYRDNPLISLLKNKGKSIDIDDSSAISEQICELNSQIGDLEEVKEVSSGIKEILDKSIGKTYAPIIEIKSELPDDIERLLQSLKLWVGDQEDSNYTGHIREIGLGGANLIYLSLKLLEYEQKQSQDIFAHFLLIEEPEAHIHTHIQKTLFDNIDYENTQIIFSTHSTHISAASKISSMNILGKERQASKVFQPKSGLELDQIGKIERYLDAIRSTLLFAKGVILVEGDAELILIPEMVKIVFGISLDEIGVSIIKMGSAFFEHIALLFHDERVQRHCAIITDLDSSIIPLKSDDKKDSKKEKKCRASQKAGLERKEKLDAFCENNPWLKPFYARYTFEVDFLLSGNEFEVKQTLNEIFEQKNAIKESQKKLESNKNSDKELEILRLAKKVGKGWLALLISEKLVYNTYFPEYILRAIAFASAKNINEQILRHMVEYRSGTILLGRR